jgi:hypothetical protein
VKNRTNLAVTFLLATLALVALLGINGGRRQRFLRDPLSHLSPLSHLVMFAGIGVAAAIKGYSDHRRRQAAVSWFPAAATVEGSHETMLRHNQGKGYRISYSYTFQGEYYSGSVAVREADWSHAPSSLLKGTPLTIRVNPRKPSQTVLEAISMPGLKDPSNPALIVAEQ